jgi:hypothetical protein
MATDPLLVVHCDGAPSSTTFTDASGNGRNITTGVQVGGGPSNTVISSNAYFGSGSMAVPATNYDGLLVDASTDFAFGPTDPFTIDFWVNCTSIPGSGNMCLFHIPPNTLGWIPGAGLNIYFQDQSGVHNCVTTFSPSLNTWHHICLMKDSSSNIWMFCDGVNFQTPTSYNSPYPIGDGVTTPAIGNARNGGTPFNGYIDEVRVSKSAIFPTAGFTPPTMPWPFVYSWPTKTQWNIS